MTDVEVRLTFVAAHAGIGAEFLHKTGFRGLVLIFGMQKNLVKDVIPFGLTERVGFGEDVSGTSLRHVPAGSEELLR